MRARQIKLTSVTAILAFALATLGFAATPANAADAFSLTYSGTTELTVTGHTGPWPSSVEIPAQVNGVPVVAIGDNVFYGASSSSIKMHEGIRTIGRWAFAGSGISNIEFPASLNSVDLSAFYMVYFESITFDGNRNSVVADAFDGIDMFTKIYVYEDATGFNGKYGAGTVYRMTHFKYSITNTDVTITGYGGNAPSDLVVPSSIEGKPVVGLADGALANLGINSVKLPNTLKTIGDSALVGNFLSSVVIPPSVTRIGNWAFSFNPNLTSVTLQGNAPTVGFDPWVMTNQNLTYLNVYDTATGYGAQWAGHDIHVIGAASSEATLSLLAPARGSFNETYAPTTYNYTMNVDGTVDSLQVLPNPENQFATVKINGVAAAGWALSDPIALAVGQTTITVEVTAQDGYSTHTYTLVVTRATPRSNDATLSAISLSAGALQPVFSAPTSSYTVNVPYTQTSVSVTATRNESHATITVNGNAIASGVASGAVILTVGNNNIPVVVTAEDGTQKTYTVNIVRAAASNDSRLSGITLTPVAIDTTFDPAVTSYHAVVPNAQATIDFSATTNESHATLQVNGVTRASGFTVQGFALNVGMNHVAFAVTAQDGKAATTYDLFIERMAKSSNSTLSGLSVSSGSLSPAFNSETKTYSVSVGNSTSSYSVTPTIADKNATVTVNGTAVASGATSGSKSLSVGENVFTIVVTAEDATTSTYTVKVTRAAAPVIKKPVFKDPVSILGTTPHVGKTLTVAPLNLGGDKAQLEYSWFRCNTPVKKHLTNDPNPSYICRDILRANKRTYVLTAADRGYYILVEVIARNSRGIAISTSLAARKTL